MAMKDRWPELVEAEEKYREAKRKFKETVARIQEQCSHELVAQGETKKYDFGSAIGPVRICYKCGLEEHARAFTENYSWENKDGETKLGNHKDRLVVNMSQDEVYKLRV